MKEKIVCNDTILDDDISSFAPTFSNLLFFSEIESCRPEMKKIRNIFLLLSLVAPTVRTRKCKTLVCISLPSPVSSHLFTQIPIITYDPHDPTFKTIRRKNPSGSTAR